MKKTILHLPSTQPRNPFVVKAMTAKAGKHQKTEKSNRQQQKKALRKIMNEQEFECRPHRSALSPQSLLTFVPQSYGICL